MKILITGAAGMIGYSLCEHLYKHNFDFFGIDLIQPAYKEVPLNYFKQIDCRNLESLMSLNDTFDLVIHLAAHSSVIPLIESPKLALENIAMTLNILEFCKIKKIKNLIFSSSREVYGSRENYFFKENDVLIQDTENPYGMSKLSCESLIAAYTKKYDINAIITRFSNVFGKYDFTGRVIPIFIEKCLKNYPLTIFGKNKTLDFIYIEDVIIALRFFINNPIKNKIEIYNIMSKYPTKLFELAEILKEKTNSQANILLEPNRPGETNCFCGDNQKFLNKYKNFKITKFDNALSSTIQWYSQYY